MSYDHQSKLFIDPRPGFITPANMEHPVMKLDHRIPWNLLRGTLNKILRRELNSEIINALMKLSPANNVDMIKSFKVAVEETRPGKLPPEHQIRALNTIEQLIFSLPCNLALGLNERADDPGGDRMDFTPDDVDHAGAYRNPSNGNCQQFFETLFGLLSAPQIDLKAVDICCNGLRTRWTPHHPNGMSDGTGGNYANWHPGPPAVGIERTRPPYRYWRKPDGTALSVIEIMTMIGFVTARAKRYGGKPR